MSVNDLIQQARYARDAFNEEIGRGPDDQAKMFYKIRDLQGKDSDAPRMDKTMGEHPLVYRIRENLGLADKDAMEARAQLGMEMKQTPGGRAGQLAGAAGADLFASFKFPPNCTMVLVRRSFLSTFLRTYSCCLNAHFAISSNIARVPFSSWITKL